MIVGALIISVGWIVYPVVTHKVGYTGELADPTLAKAVSECDSSLFEYAVGEADQELAGAVKYGKEACRLAEEKMNLLNRKNMPTFAMERLNLLDKCLTDMKISLVDIEKVGSDKKQLVTAQQKWSGNSDMFLHFYLDVADSERARRILESFFAAAICSWIAMTALSLLLAFASKKPAEKSA